MIITLDRRQSKMLLTIGKGGSRIAKNSVFNCRLLPAGQQMAVKNSVSSYFWSTVLDNYDINFSIAAYPVWSYDKQNLTLMVILYKFSNEMVTHVRFSIFTNYGFYYKDCF